MLDGASEDRYKPWKQSDWGNHAKHTWWPSSTAAHGSYREDWQDEAPDHHDALDGDMTSTIEVKDETPTPDQEADLVWMKNEPADPAPDVDANGKGARWGWGHNDGYNDWQWNHEAGDDAWYDDYAPLVVIAHDDENGVWAATWTWYSESVEAET